MSNTSNRPFTLLTPPSEDLLRVVRQLAGIAAQLQVPFFLVGAAARDLVLVNLWGGLPGRATADIDFAFAVNDWPQFEQLRGHLIATELFERVPRRAQRLLYTDPDYGFRLPIDFIPFGPIASGTHTIAWPPKGDFVLNVAGFEAALASALRIELEPALVVAVTSLPGLAILKTIAWCDRHLENNKDASDLYKLLTTYDLAGNQDRIFDEELDLLESLGYDLTLAGAWLLGLDAARIADSRADLQIKELLNSETKTGLLISQMIATSSYEENTAFVVRIFDSFRQGYLADQSALRK